MAYEYKQLDKSRRQFRLLTFELDNLNKSRIHCRLDTYDLDECPGFVVLSYIYSTATSVFAWLGPVSGRLNRVINCEGDVYCWWKMLEYEHWHAIEDIRQREYWTRMWTVQEFLLPKRVILLIGHIKMTWEWLLLGCSFKECSCRICSFGRASCRLPLVCQKLCSENRGAIGLTLLALMDRFGSGLGTDPRDRVYALQSLVPQPYQSRKRLQADYSITTQQLYYRVLGHCWDQDRWYPNKQDRETLAKKLEIVLDEEYRTNDIVYDVMRAFQGYWDRCYSSWAKSCVAQQDGYLSRLESHCTHCGRW